MPALALALTVDQPYFFGWPVTPAWLTAFTICCTNGKTAYPTETDAFNELRTRSGFRYLSIDRVVHGNAPVWPGPADPPPGVLVFKIISICNTRREKYYAESRPMLCDGSGCSEMPILDKSSPPSGHLVLVRGVGFLRRRAAEELLGYGAGPDVIQNELECGEYLRLRRHCVVCHR